MSNEELPPDFAWTSNSTNLCYKRGDESWCGDKSDCTGLVLPLFFEDHWNQNFRAFLYLFGLLYSFLGISIVADIFMCAIEKITSKKKQIHIASGSGDEAGDDIIEVQVWNGTVANLTLMALGSSAPEILLAVVGVVGNNFNSEELGPGTIVGSAAFNLLAISAVCITGVPDGESRRINNFSVFCVTAICSVFAYFWLLVILVFISKDVVEVWEAALTFLFFPVLVLVAYAADKGWLFCKSPKSLTDKQRQIELGNVQPGESEEMLGKEYFKDGKVDKKALVSFIRDIKKNTKLSDIDAAKIAASKVVDSQPKSRIWYRIGATRNITGGRRINPGSHMSTKLREVYDAINEHDDLPNIDYPDADASKSIIEFHASSAAVMENIGTFKVLICRHGNRSSTVKVRVETIDGSATEGDDYVKVDEILTFQPNETEKEIGITIVDDNQWEPDEEFFLKLNLVSNDDNKEVKLGRTSIMEVMILNDDEPGTFQFEKRGHLVKESCGDALISVIRQNGADGEVEVKWRTVDKTAINGKDYNGGEGVLSFKHGETQRDIVIPIVNDLEPEKDELFEIELVEVTEGAKLGKVKRTAVTITNDDEFNNVMSKLLLMTNANVDGMRVHNETWAQQLKDAMVVNGGDLENATTGDYVMHFLTFGFKLIFALIPPPGMMGGWLCFTVSLFMIGLLVIIVGDLANIFGCLVGLNPEVTAITFVALGTSLPDTFASKTAAISEKYADNAVGNVTGSNSVNVFMGLGIPWLIASIYWSFKDPEKGFVVEAGSLGFSVTLYTICALIAIMFLMARRFIGAFGNAELGGNVVLKWVSGGFFLFLWVLYIVLSSLYSYKIIQF
jgi:solute carrier family 8 (sodium/calcium exchanger)